MSPKLSALLNQIRSRLWLIDGGAAACLAVVGALLTVVLGMWFDLVWELPSGVRAATWGCAAVALVAALTGLLLRTRRGCQIQAMAKKVDDAASLGGQLMNGWELSGQLA